MIIIKCLHRRDEWVFCVRLACVKIINSLQAPQPHPTPTKTRLIVCQGKNPVYPNFNLMIMHYNVHCKIINNNLLKKQYL